MGRPLATRTGRFVDTDLLVEDAFGPAVAEVVSTEDFTVEEVAVLVEKLWNGS